MKKFILLYFFVLYSVICFGQSEITDYVKVRQLSGYNNNKLLVADDNGNLGFYPIVDFLFPPNTSLIPTGGILKTEFNDIPKFKNLPLLDSNKLIVLDDQGNIGYKTLNQLTNTNSTPPSGNIGLEAGLIKLNLSAIPDVTPPHTPAYDYVLVAGNNNILGKRYLAEVTKVVSDFTYVTIEYLWDSSNGTDLDIAVGLSRVPSVPAVNNKSVGWKSSGRVETLGSRNYLRWAGDNRGTDYGEAVVYSPDDLYEEYHNLPNKIDLYLTCIWFSTRNNGNVRVKVIAYRGGTMEPDPNTGNYLYKNVGGRKIFENIFPARNIGNTDSSDLENSRFAKSPGSDNFIGIIRYTRSTKSLEFIHFP